MGTRHTDRDTDALTWFKSSYSGSGGGECIEIARTPRLVYIRDSKDTAGAVLRVTPEAWGDFVEFAKKRGPLAR